MNIFNLLVTEKNVIQLSILLAKDIDDVLEGHRRVGSDIIGDEGELAKRRPRGTEMLRFLVFIIEGVVMSQGEGRT